MVVSRDLQLAQQFASELAQSLGENLLRISLFGSRARRDHRERSDYDFMIVLRDATKEVRSAIHRRALQWELHHLVDFSTKILSQGDYQRLLSGPELFWRNFQRDERKLWPTN
jgi:predicted nucleotidyltransferase